MVIISFAGKIYTCSYLFFQLILAIQGIAMFVGGWYIGSEVRRLNKRRQ